MPTPLEQALERFDLAWRGGTPPSIEAFLTEPGVDRRVLAQELVKIDLEYRWRLRLPLPNGSIRPARLPGPVLEDYAGLAPDLGPAGQWPVTLLAEEYRVRHRWGDRPDPEEYLRRFPGQREALREALRRLDAELAGEFARPVDAPQLTAVPAGTRLAPADSEAITTGAALLSAARQWRLLQPAQLADLSQGGPGDSRSLARELLRRGWLTPYQANQLCQGRGGDLVIGPYLLLERLGEGGAGQVFKARHQKMNRVVALKLLRRELLSDTEAVQRFYREFHILGRMTHPNIVHAFDAGQAGGCHFLAMEFVEGTDLGRLVKQSGPLPVGRACEYIRQAALGLQHAYDKDLVHRDIKPPNLLLSKDGMVKILDLGLARLGTVANGEVTATLAQEKFTSLVTPANAVMMGTADFMAPEQALDFHTSDIRADIYSLGCTLFYLLTGQPPFPGGTIVQKLWKHQQGNLPDIRQLRPEVPAAVAAILARMMAREPAARFQRPAEVVAALAPWCSAGQRRFSVRGLMAEARYRVARLGKGRRRWLLAGLCLLPLALGVGVAWKMSTPRPVPLAQLTSHDVPPQERFPWQPADLVAVLGQHRGRHWGPATTVAFSPDGAVVASGGSDQAVRLWDWASGQERAVLRGHTGPILMVAFAPDGARLVSVAEERAVRVWDAAGEELAAVTQVAGVRCAAFLAGGQTLALGHGTRGGPGVVTLWNWAAKQEQRSLSGIRDVVNAVAVSPDGQMVAAGSAEGDLKVWDVASGKEKAGRAGWGRSLAFAADNRSLAFVGRDGAAKLWDYVSGAEQLACKPPAGSSLVGADPGRTLTPALVPAAPGRLLLLQGDGSKERARFNVETRELTGIAVAPHGRAVAAATAEGFVRLLDVAAGGQRIAGAGQTSGIGCVAAAPDLRTFAVGTGRGNIQLRSFDGGRPLVLCDDPALGAVQALAFAPDGQALAGATRDGQLKLWDALSGKERRALQGPDASLRALALAFAPDGRSLISGNADGIVRVWDPATGRVRHTLKGHKDPALVACTPDSRQVITGGSNGAVRRWDLESGAEQVALQAPGVAGSMTYVPAANAVAVGQWDHGHVRRWDVGDGRELPPLKTPFNTPSTLAFSPDGRTCAVATYRGSLSVLLLDTASGTKLREWKFPGPIASLSFAPDGQHLVTINGDGTAYVLRLALPQATR